MIPVLQSGVIGLGYSALCFCWHYVAIIQPHTIPIPSPYQVQVGMDLIRRKYGFFTHFSATIRKCKWQKNSNITFQALLKFPGFSGIFCNLPAIMSGVSKGVGKSRKIPEERKKMGEKLSLAWGFKFSRFKKIFPPGTFVQVWSSRVSVDVGLNFFNEV